MPNAKNDAHTKSRNVLIFGTTGAGKTQQFSTLPGRKFAYLFDPNAIDTLQGEDIDYEEFLPDRLDLSITSLSKNKQPGTKSTLKATNVYAAWEKHFEHALETGFFDDYDNILVDSLTTFSDMVMDSVLSMNGRAGQWPQQDDYGPQMNAIMKVFRVMTALNKRVYVTGHVEMVKDELSQRVFYQPMVTGRLKTKLPLLFSNIFFATAEMQTGTKKEVMYQLQTKPDRLTPLIRCTFRGLDYKEDVTLDFSKPLEGQGLGRIITSKETT